MIYYQSSVLFKAKDYFLGSANATDVNYDIIKHRTGKDPKEFYQTFLEFVSKINSKDLLNGLGEVLTEPQKDWAKAKLVIELDSLIKKMLYYFPSFPISAVL
mgnify:CR=1 FL=1